MHCWHREQKTLVRSSQQQASRQCHRQEEMHLGPVAGCNRAPQEVADNEDERKRASTRLLLLRLLTGTSDLPHGAQVSEAPGHEETHSATKVQAATKLLTGASDLPHGAQVSEAPGRTKTVSAIRYHSDTIEPKSALAKELRATNEWHNV